MNNLKKSGLLAVAVFGATLAPALAHDLTVGRFYAELASSKHLAFVDAASAEAGLRGAGYKLPTLALDKSLTEGDVVGISTAMGLGVTSQNPAQSFTERQLTTYMAYFGNRLKVPVGGAQTNGGSQGGNNQGGNQGGNNQGQNNNNQGQEHSRSRP